MRRPQNETNCKQECCFRFRLSDPTTAHSFTFMAVSGSSTPMACALFFVRRFTRRSSCGENIIITRRVTYKGFEKTNKHAFQREGA